MKKKLIIFLIIVLILTTLPVFNVVFADYIPVNLTFDTIPLALSPQPVQDTNTNRTLVPIRPFCEAAGMNLIWRDADFSFTISKGENFLTFFIGNPNMYVSSHPDGQGGAPVSLDAPPCLIDERTFVPVRALTEGMGYTVSWDETSKTVSILASAKGTLPMAEATAVVFDDVPTPDLPSLSEEDTLTPNLYAHMPKDQNFMVSPLSLKLALAMVAEGADEETRGELLKAIDVKNLDAFHSALADMLEYLKACNSDRNNLILDIANSVWLNQAASNELNFSEEYTQIIEDIYHGSSQAINEKNPHQTVNNWVSEKTRGKINQLLDNDAFTIALVNTIYMEANWINDFELTNTASEKFMQRNGKEAEIDMMHQTDNFKYYQDKTLQAIALPYYGDMTMYVVLPEKGIDPSSFLSHIKEMTYQSVILTLPKFTTKTSMDFSDILREMEIKKAFLSSAEFPFMFSSKNSVPPLQKVLQSTYINVDEKGTTAAAASSAQLQSGSSITNPITFTADRPFTYFICFNPTDEVFFMGEYAYVQ